MLAAVTALSFGIGRGPEVVTTKLEPIALLLRGPEDNLTEVKPATLHVKLGQQKSQAYGR